MAAVVQPSGYKSPQQTLNEYHSRIIVAVYRGSCLSCELHVSRAVTMIWLHWRRRFVPAQDATPIYDMAVSCDAASLSMSRIVSCRTVLEFLAHLKDKIGTQRRGHAPPGLPSIFIRDCWKCPGEAVSIVTASQSVDEKYTFGYEARSNERNGPCLTESTETQRHVVCKTSSTPASVKSGLYIPIQDSQGPADSRPVRVTVARGTIVSSPARIRLSFSAHRLPIAYREGEEC
ncbi:hypothetical protein EJ07DRAFT_159951 [Lizonia empirigonia]|nr:hypothetical protein EJ07DRAFT_159951 [Lizonia empirigonia]